MRNPAPAVVALLFALSTHAAAQAVTFARDDYSMDAGARAIVSADFNRDGWPDVAIANGDRSSVTILLNQSGTGLTRAGDVAVGGVPFNLVTADVNRDGIPDLAAANAGSNSISVLLGKGDGTFSRSDISTPSQNPRGIAAADVNSDGEPDLIYSAYATGEVQVLIGDGAGHFTKGVVYVSSAPHPQGIVTGDFNHDGHLDLAVAYASGAGLRILYGNGGTAFTARTVTGATYLNVVAVGDFNGDGWMDVAGASNAYSTVAIYLGSASGLVHAQTYNVGSSPRGIAIGDLNEDGMLDVVTGNRASSTVSVLLGDLAHPGTFLPPLEIAAGLGSRDAVVTDFDGDGRLDIATANELATSATVLSNQTAFVAPGYAFTRLSIGDPTSVSSSVETIPADFNRDGRMDVVAGGVDAVSALVQLNGGATVSLPVPGPLTTIAVEDLNGDGNLDIVYGVFATGSGASVIGAYLGDGRGGFTMAPVTYWNVWSGARSCAVGDMNRDGKPDLVCAGFGDPGTYVLKVGVGRGDGSFAPPVTTLLLPDVPSRVALADVNRDGRLDVAVMLDGFVRGQPSETRVWSGDGTGGLVATSLTTSFIAHYGVGFNIADVNHDGYLDIVASESPQMAVALGGATGFAAPVYTPVGPDVVWLGAVEFGDLNLDGNLDVAFGSGDVMFGTGDGSFVSAGRFAYGVNGGIADVTGDGLPDIISGVVLLANTRGHTNHPPTVNAGPDQTIPYAATQGEDCGFALVAAAQDRDAHALTYEWRRDGVLVSTDPVLQLCGPPPGTYAYSVTVRDGRGGTATDNVQVTIEGIKEIVLWAADAETEWTLVGDQSAAGGVRAYDPNLGAPKVTTPATDPPKSLRFRFYADPTVTYKLWIRLKADGNSWANDSVWVQFGGATDPDGTPKYQVGTTSGLAVSLEECLGCGVAGWGWQDDGWGAPNKNGVLLRFPQNSDRDPQGISIQTREDGVSIDQIVLSGQRYLTTSPGPAKNDRTILPSTQPPR